MKIYKLTAFFIITMFIFGTLMNIYMDTDAKLSDAVNKIIRLHVVANSDSPEDQALKLKVRDAIIKEMDSKFEGLTDTAQVKKVIEENISDIETIAKEVIDKEGKVYDVKAKLGVFSFPTKVYGNLTLPAGDYQALNVIIGSGKGKNWWCVMFPPLCFIDVAHGVVPENTMDKLKNSLTEEEYELLVSTESEKEIPVKLKLKIVELARKLNLRIAFKGVAK